MPKVKTSSACKKRFKKNCNNKIKRSSSYRSHHSWAKDRNKIRKLRKTRYVSATQEKKIGSLLPY